MFTLHGAGIVWIRHPSIYESAPLRLQDSVKLARSDGVSIEKHERGGPGIGGVDCGPVQQIGRPLHGIVDICSPNNLNRKALVYQPTNSQSRHLIHHNDEAVSGT